MKGNFYAEFAALSPDQQDRLFALAVTGGAVNAKESLEQLRGWFLEWDLHRAQLLRNTYLYADLTRKARVLIMAWAIDPRRGAGGESPPDRPDTEVRDDAHGSKNGVG